MARPDRTRPRGDGRQRLIGCGSDGSGYGQDTGLLDLFKRDRKARDLGERDAPADLGESRSRPVQGTPGPDTQDTTSSTGTAPDGEFVGRTGGDEAVDVGESGAERRAAVRDDQGNQDS